MLAQFIASLIFLAPMMSAAITSSLTAFAFAPGVLKTQIPFLAYSACGILFTPAPALATANREDGTSYSSILKERTSMPTGFCELSVRLYPSSTGFASLEIELSFKISIFSPAFLNDTALCLSLAKKRKRKKNAFAFWLSGYLFSSSNFFMKSISAFTPSTGIAL